MFLINRFIIGSRHGSLCVYFSQDFLPCPCSWHSLAYFTFYFFSRSLIVLISIELHSLWSQSTGTIFRQSLIGGCLEKGTAETPWKEHKHLFSFSALGRERGSFPQPNPSCSALQHQLPSAAQEDLERILRWTPQREALRQPSTQPGGAHSWTASWSDCPELPAICFKLFPTCVERGQNFYQPREHGSDVKRKLSPAKPKCTCCFQAAVYKC